MMILQMVWPPINMVWPLNMRSHILLLNIIMFLLFITYLQCYLLFIIYICFIEGISMYEINSPTDAQLLI